MGVYVQPIAEALVDLATLLASTNWTAMKLHLSTNNFTPSKNNVLTDYSSGEANFVGYSAQSVTFGAPHTDPAGNVVATALASFLCSASTTPNSLYTYYLTNTAGTVLIAGGVLDNAPVNIANVGDGTSQVIEAMLGQGNVTEVG